MTNIKKINRVQMDAIEKSANRGVYHASKHLSQIFEGSVDVDLIVTNLFPIQDILDDPTKIYAFTCPDAVIMTAYTPMTGDTSGAGMLLFPKESAVTLVDFIKGKDIGTTTELNLEDNSVLSSVCSAFVSSYLTAINKVVELNTTFSNPSIVLDSVDSIVNVIHAISSEQIANMLVSEIRFSSDKTMIYGTFILAFDEKSLDKLLDSINKIACIKPNSFTSKLTGVLNRILR